jgi:hypothetical protein
MSGLPTLWEPVPWWRVVTTPERKERAGTGRPWELERETEGGAEYGEERKVREEGEDGGAFKEVGADEVTELRRAEKDSIFDKAASP